MPDLGPYLFPNPSNQGAIGGSLFAGSSTCGNATAGCKSETKDRLLLAYNDHADIQSLPVRNTVLSGQASEAGYQDCHVLSLAVMPPRRLESLCRPNVQLQHASSQSTLTFYP